MWSIKSWDYKEKLSINEPSVDKSHDPPQYKVACKVVFTIH